MSTKKKTGSEPEQRNKPLWSQLLPEPTSLITLKAIISAPLSTTPMERLRQALDSPAYAPAAFGNAERFIALKHAIIMLRAAQESYLQATSKPSGTPWYERFDDMDASGPAGRVMLATEGLTGEVR